MTHAIVIHEPGDPRVLRYEQIELPDLQRGQVRIRHNAIGVNFIDTYYRSGLYDWPHAPLIPGSEGAGEVVAVGAGVTHVAPGDRVTYTTPVGAYAEERILDAGLVTRLPDDISDEVAAAVTLKGLTAQYLLRQTFRVEAGHTILFHAAAGGVGLLAGQWAASLGATVIGTVGSDEKADLARSHGYTHVINYRTENFVDSVRELTGGRGVDVVYDSVGQDTYPHSLDCLKKRGMWVCFGQSSGPIRNFEISHLVSKGSLFATRPRLFDYIDTPEALAAAAAELFAAIRTGMVKVMINQRFPLQDAAEAHRQLESRQTTGSTILLPKG